MPEATTPPRRPRRTAGRRRPRGEGSVYQAKDGRWRGALVVAAEDGTRRRVVVSGRTEDEARDRLDDVRRRARRDPGQTAKPSNTVEAFLTGWLERNRRQVRPSTWLSRKGHIGNHIIPALGRKRLDRLTPADVEGMTADLVKQGLSPRTAGHVRVTLRTALRDAQRDGQAHQNAAALARAPRVEHVEMNVLDAEQTRLLLMTTREDRWGPLWALLAGSGMRIGEAMALTWDDLDFNSGSVAISKSWAKVAPKTWALSEPKTARSRRTIPIPATVMRALRELYDRQEAERELAGDAWQRNPEGQPLFVDQYGRRPGVSHFSLALHKALRAAGLPRVRVHDLRHSYASTLLAQGIPLLTVSRMLGHSTITITANTYSHVSDGLQRDAADALEVALAGR